MRPNSITPIMKKILKKIFLSSLDVEQIGLSLNLNDLTLTKSVRKLWESGYILRDHSGIYSISPLKKDLVLDVLRNKKKNKYEIHKILGDCVDLVSENIAPDSFDFHEIKLSTLNAKILESKMKELKEFILKLQTHSDDKNIDSKTYYVYRGMIEERILRHHVDDMYIRFS